MSEDIVIADRLTKTYKVYARPSDHLREIASLGRRCYHRDFKALDDVSFSLVRGDRLGIVGENGSGKSTLLKMLSSVLTPTSGAYYVGGRVTSLLELGTGFNPDLTGEENVFQNGMLIGYSRQEMKQRFPLIHDFSELGDFIWQPLKTYSSGMMVRLAFSCAVFVEPEILIIDEALSVGDAYFQNKCFYKIRSLLDQGVTFIYVTHNYDSIKSLCNKGLMLEQGRVAMAGEAKLVSDYYFKTILEKQNRSRWYQSMPEAARSNADGAEQAPEQSQALVPVLAAEFSRSDAFARQVAPLRSGTGDARITDVALLNTRGEKIDRLYWNEEAAIRVYFEVKNETSVSFSVGAGICDAKGVQVIQFTSLDEECRLGGLPGGAEVIIDFCFRSPLAPGQYNIQLGIADLINSPIHPAYRIIEKTIDFCVGGYQFEVPFENIPKAIWGKVSCPVKVQRVQ